jgi:Fe2+ or Zn2+ uptake regulation protein
MRSLIEQVQKQLVDSGGRMTPQRRMILQKLESFPGHPTAEELYLSLIEEAPDLNISTVYRTMRWLEQEGMISSLWLGDDRGQERFDAGLVEEHHHFICTRCKGVVEFSTPVVDEIKARFEAEFGGSVEAASVALSGLCAACQADEMGACN